jgi:hypothetical protein
VSVTLILDTTAATAYMRQSIVVGELIGMIADDRDTAVLPAVCLAEAASMAKGEEQVNMLHVLSILPGVLVTPFLPHTAIDLGSKVPDVGSLGMAHAVAEALIAEAQLATADVLLARRILPAGWNIVPV